MLAVAMGAGLVGCGSSEGTTEDPNKGPGPGGEVPEKLEIFFPKLNSAFIPGSDRKFKVPAVAQGVKADRWECSDKDAVDFEYDGVMNGVMITMRKAGEFKIRAYAGKRMGEVPLVVTAATEADWERGKERYNNKIALMLTPQTLAGAGMGGMGFRLEQNLACTNCHGSGATYLAVEHTPQQTGGYTDDEIKNIFMNGQKPPGAMFGSLPGIMNFYPMFHKWTANPEDYQGLVVYLRSLEPKSQGALDFMGLVNSLRAGRGMMGAAPGGAAGSAPTAPAGMAGSGM